jgi:hypothetical protein
MASTTISRRVFVAGGTPAAAALTATVPSQAIGRTPAPTASTCGCPACTGLICLDRTRFFSGQLLTEADLNNEQSYWLAKSRLHNRFLNGWGVVCGMQVVCSECAGWVTVKTGYAIDPCGNDIIVCTDQNFNVLKAIQACCSPSSQSPNCSPLRYNPPPECQNTPQHWCITIEYQEQQSRLVTPLVQAAPKTSSCGCGGSSTGGCGCGGGSSMQSSYTSGSASGCGCSSSQTQTAATVPTGACEPTRILEGFKLGICPAPTPSIKEGAAPPAPGTANYQYQNCIQGLDQLAAMAPATFAPGSDPNVAYQATCSYYAIVNNYFAQNQFVNHCQLLDDLAQIPIPLPAPPPAGTGDTYNAAVSSILGIVARAHMDCLCMALIPSCPPDPCDDRLILACVSVQNGAIVNICPFEGRQQLIGFTALNYWLGPLFTNIMQLLDNVFERLCCTSATDIIRNGSLFPAQAAYDRTNFTTDGISNPAVFNRLFSTLLAQKLGASMVNLLSPTARAVDLRPFVGQPSTDALAKLGTQGFAVINQDVTNDLSWDAAAISAAAQFAPAAASSIFSGPSGPSKQSLTAYSKGGLLVGIEVTDPTTLLQAQVTKLQHQVDQLTNTNAGAAPPATGTIATIVPQQNPPDASS